MSEEVSFQSKTHADGLQSSSCTVASISARELLLLSVLIALVIIPRIAWIDLRPLHHDEGVNFFFLEQIARIGFYQYSHENYHGPLFFYLTALSRSLFGDGVLSLRLSSIIAGIIVCFIPSLFFRRTLSLIPLTTTTLLLAVSGSGVFHSRYAIHEILLLLCFLSMASATAIFFRERRPSLSIGGVAAVSASLCFATKETTLIVGLATVISAAVVFGPSRVSRRIVELFYFGGWWIFGSVFLIIILFSGGFQWSAGLREFFIAFSQWISRGIGDTGHFKPWSYYILLLWQTEPVLLLAPLIPILGLIPSVRSALGDSFHYITFFSFVGSIVLAIQSAIPYKMPWLVIQISGPLIISVGITLGIFIEKILSNRQLSLFVRSILLSLLTLPVLLHAYFMIQRNFVMPYGSQNPFSYVHTDAGMLRLVERLSPMLARDPSLTLLIGVSSYWPLPYYLREFGAGQLVYQHAAEITDQLFSHSLILIDKEISVQLPANPCFQQEAYRLSDAQESYLLINLCQEEPLGSGSKTPPHDGTKSLGKAH
ncbi:MAG: glycosyltransferase family 39 protein [Bdellovibrionota bacterium]